MISGAASGLLLLVLVKAERRASLRITIGRSDRHERIAPQIDVCWEPLLCEEVLMEALPHKQAEDHLAEAVFIIRYHFQEPNAHGFRA